MPISVVKLVIDGNEILINIREEMEKYDWGYGARWSDDKLIAQSPFREDRSPSFYVDFTGEYAGLWGDSGSTDPNTSYGSLPKLISMLRRISVQDAKDYLIDEYGVGDRQDRLREIKLPSVKLKAPKPVPTIDMSRFIRKPSEYLNKRGISDEVQEDYGIGHMVNSPEYVSLSWTDERDGSIVSIKNRASEGRGMYYEKGSVGISSYVFGLYQAKNNPDYVVICEGEADVLSFAEAGINAVALGTASISNKQADKIKHQGFSRIYMGGDNDEAGLNLNRKIYAVFKGISDLYLVKYVEHSDANEVLLSEGVEGLQKVINDAKEIKPKLISKKT